MNKPIYLGLSILEISKLLMYEFWYDDVYTENINKIALSSNDDKRLIASDKVTSYPYEYQGKQALV